MNNMVSRQYCQLRKKSIDPTTAFGQSWLLQKMDQLIPTAHDRMEILKDRERQKSQSVLGRLYFFAYDAKTKEKLKYWDKFPLVIPIEEYHDGFLGLNLHYIPPKHRLVFMRQLMMFAAGSRQDERMRLQLSYPILKALAGVHFGTPCIKRYLSGYVKSRFIEIPSIEWEVAAALPYATWTSKTGTSEAQIWRDSQNKYGK
jgi:hypothetical protein